MITNINVNSIVNNVNNPRKDLGDLQELRDSIARNGVLQPLTVVPDAGGYKVVIGHRRLEAARQAGVEEVPCVVEDWSEEQQLNVMMMENMLREQLTTYEEAKGFQMMLDLGKSVETIAEETGFSQSTVRNRTKLLSLNEDGFKKSIERGATLGDLSKLYDIEDEHMRNAVLKSAGTKEFQSKLQSAVEAERREKKMADAETHIAAWAKKIEKSGFVDGEQTVMHYVDTFNYWSDKIPDCREEGKAFYYTVDEFSIRIYMEGEAPIDTEAEERRAREQMISHSLDDATQSCYKLRLNFIQNFGNFRKYGKHIMRTFVQAALRDMSRSSWRSFNLDQLGTVLGTDDLADNLDKLNDFTMEKVALGMLMVYNDSDRACTWKSSWQSDGWHYIYEQNENLNEWYAFLMSIGYQPSTEEVNFMNGDVEYVEKETAA